MIKSLITSVFLGVACASSAQKASPFSVGAIQLEAIQQVYHSSSFQQSTAQPGLRINTSFNLSKAGIYIAATLFKQQHSLLQNYYTHRYTLGFNVKLHPLKKLVILPNVGAGTHFNAFSKPFHANEHHQVIPMVESGVKLLTPLSTKWMMGISAYYQCSFTQPRQHSVLAAIGIQYQFNLNNAVKYYFE